MDLNRIKEARKTVFGEASKCPHISGEEEIEEEPDNEPPTDEEKRQKEEDLIQPLDENKSATIRVSLIEIKGNAEKENGPITTAILQSILACPPMEKKLKEAKCSWTGRNLRRQ